MYSALKVNGQKLVDLARKGQVIERKPRPITIYEINVIDISLPLVTMEVSCSKGTYIRTLCNDIGEKLKCGAAMDSLVRVRAAGFEIDDALKLSEIEILRDQGVLEDYILGIDEALEEYPAVKADVKCTKILANGGSVLIEDTDYKEDIYLRIDDKLLVRMYMADGTFVGVYEKKETAFKPNKMFLEA